MGLFCDLYAFFKTKGCQCHFILWKGCQLQKRLRTYDGNGNGLLFNMTQLISRSNTKNHRTLGKLTVSEY